LTPVDTVDLVGFVYAPAAAAVNFAPADWPAGWPKRIGQLDIEHIARDAQARPGSGAGQYRFPLIVDGGGPGTFAYNFEAASFSPVRHWGYAVQWFAMAAGIVLYLGYRSWQRT
jgi:cytochrome oxidase assembly protein ShyY1